MEAPYHGLSPVRGNSSFAMNLRRLEHYERLLNELALSIVHHAKRQDLGTSYRLRSVPGVTRRPTRLPCYPSFATPSAMVQTWG
jgi:hypothetical protein